MGLALAKLLVDLHGGTIEAHSAGDSLGSEFVVRLPIREAEPARPRDPQAQAGRKAARVRRRILVVDDNHDSAESLRVILEMAGHEVRVAFDGESSLAEATRFKPEAVLVDIALPDMDGYDLARRLRGAPATRDVLIVATTGFGRMQDLQRSRDAGIDWHLAKPLDVERLGEYLQNGRG